MRGWVSVLPQANRWGKIVKNITSIIIIFLVSGCITVPTPPNPAAASAVVGTAMVVKMVMPVLIAAGVGILIAKQMKEPDRCKSPVKSEEDRKSVV